MAKWNGRTKAFVTREYKKERRVDTLLALYLLLAGGGSMLWLVLS